MRRQKRTGRKAPGSMRGYAQRERNGFALVKKTILWRTDDAAPDPTMGDSMNCIQRTLAAEEITTEAAAILRAGGLVAFPTETVYGLGASVFNASALASVFAVKGRPADNPLIAHVADMGQLELLAERVSPLCRALMDAFWPGPLSVLLPVRAGLPQELTAGLATVAVRMPRHPLALRLIRETGAPLAAPSANRSGRPSPTTAAHVLEDLGGAIDGVIDGGPCKIGIESTVIEVVGDAIVILRPGQIDVSALSAFGVPVRYDAHAVQVSADTAAPGGAAPRSPGQKYRHYAPRADLQVLMGRNGAFADFVQGALGKARAEGKRVAVLSRRDQALPQADFSYVLGEDDEMAARLYDALRACDSAGVDVIYLQGPQDEERSAALVNRLYKAAAGKILRI
ncbi:MAG: L-threonylcarbamoyladenylate synthase [Bacilli bacterium]